LAIASIGAAPTTAPAAASLIALRNFIYIPLLLSWKRYAIQVTSRDSLFLLPEWLFLEKKDGSGLFNPI
jgi:hypothetical protein